MNDTEWFKNWFNSPYYHILYQNRDNHEASNFINYVVKELQLSSSSSALDLACGKGRHSIQLKEHYKKVVGVDLSTESIAYAKKFEGNNLSFKIGDMRNYFSAFKFDVIFNLFTSFGYFNNNEDNLKVLRTCNKMLNNKGKLIIDFLNAEKVIKDHKKEEVIEISDITFNIKRQIKDQCIVKTIAVNTKNDKHLFEEKVQLINKDQFNFMLNESGFILQKCFGNYLLDNYNPEQSDRLILIAEKS